MNKSPGQGDINQSSALYRQLGQDASSTFSAVFPALKALIPVLQQTLSGSGSLYEAARSPAIAQTGQAISTAQNSSLGATANPNALWEQIASGGEQTASLGANNILTSALQALQGTIGSGMQFAGQGLGTSAAGQADIGQYENSQAQQMWNNIEGAAGTAAGMAFGMPPTGTTGGGKSGGGKSGGGSPIYTGNPATSSTENQTATPVSAPVSSGPGDFNPSGWS